MSVQDYLAAQKIGKREYNACVNKGKYPYLPVLENLISEDDIDSEVSLGNDQIPLSLVVGTCNAARTNAFAGNFMPLLEWGTEFSAKWASLSDSQVNEGIRDPIKVYEYMNKFYVLEGNKRVSVLKYFKAVTVNAEVIRKVPKKSDKPEVKIYYEFMDFYKCTKLNDIYFSQVGSFYTFMNLVGIEKGEEMDEDARKDLVSCYLSFKNAFDAKGGGRFDYPAGDAFLRFIHIFGYDTVKEMSTSEMAKNVAKSWAEFQLLSEDSEIDLSMDPGNTEVKKNILSYLLPWSSGDSKKLKVGFIYENTPQDSEWCYAHELGRQYIDETFGSQIETISLSNVKPEVEDEAAIEKMINDGADLIFVTSPAMTMASVKMAIAHPEVKILNCSLNTSHKYIRTYYARMYEAKFLTGVLAGALSNQDKIGYVAQYPVYGAVAKPVWHWGVFYEKLIQSILSGSWKYDESADNVKALNYWWGMSAGVVDLICSNKIPVETARLVEAFRSMIINGQFEPFSDEIYDQSRRLRNKKGNSLPPEEIITMDWLMDNVIGSIPDIEQLEDSVKPLVMNQGITQE